LIATALDYMACHVERFLADEHPRSCNPLAMTKKLTTFHRPCPVVGVITPVSGVAAACRVRGERVARVRGGWGTPVRYQATGA
jgi:hypothetical protein